ncbi:MAG: hypothetical protein A2Z14_03670 [Chloroflexi bacterium RBG_16_48_8]|nr:MAG: hypothetical protein A2Z14_03670 [Chloroflexi bacterium RBG_16_48_8]
MEPIFIGRVTRCSTRGFVGALRAPEPELPIFGGFCKAKAQQGKSHVIGAIYNISIEDDEFTRQMAATERPIEEELVDQQFLRQIPVEYGVLSIGYRANDQFIYALPPQPPLALAPIQVMTSEEIIDFTRQLNFIPLILSADNLPADDLLAACLKNAASIRKGPEQTSFLLEAGRYCARLLSDDLNRLENVLRNLQPEGMRRA